MENETKDKKWEEINPQVWTPEKPGDSVEGVYVRSQQNVGRYGTTMYYLEKDGVITAVWDTTIIGERMQIVNLGDYIRITYQGEEETKHGQKVKIFKLARARLE